MLFVALTVTPLVFVYMFTQQAIRELNMLKNQKIELLRGEENKLEIKRVVYQKLTSEDEVVKKAKEKFDLVRIDHMSKISVNRNRIKNIESLIKKKYD